MIRTMKNCCSRWRLKRRGKALILAALLVCALVGCGSKEREKNNTLRVGVALYTQDDTFISTIVQHLERMAQEAESSEDLKINLSVADGRSNQTTQLEQVDRFLDKGFDVLCVNIVDRTAAAVIVDKAQAAGVPLIFFNRQPVAEDIQRWEQVYYVGARAQEGGTLQGQIVLDAWLADRESLDRNGDGVLQYVMLEGEPGHQDTLLRTEYSVKALTDAGVEVEKLASDTANWNRGQASAKMSQWMTEFGEQIEVVLANNDDMALGAIDAFYEAGMDLPMVVGVDATAPALEAIKSGDLSGTVLNDAKGIVQAMLNLVLELTAGNDPGDTMDIVDSHYIWLPYQQVTQENWENFR